MKHLFLNTFLLLVVSAVSAADVTIERSGLTLSRDVVSQACGSFGITPASTHNPKILRISACTSPWTKGRRKAVASMGSRSYCDMNSQNRSKNLGVNASTKAASVVFPDEDRERLFFRYLDCGGIPFLTKIAYDVAASKDYLRDLYGAILLKDVRMTTSGARTRPSSRRRRPCGRRARPPRTASCARPRARPGSRGVRGS